MKISSLVKAGALAALIAFVGCTQPTSSGNNVTTVRADVSGKVTDNNGKALRGVKITYDAPSRGSSTVETDEFGSYRLNNLATGDYTLTFTYEVTVNNVKTSYLTTKSWLSVPTLAEYLSGHDGDLDSLAWEGLGYNDGYIKKEMDWTMYPLTGSVTGKLMLKTNGQTDANATAVNAKTVRYLFTNVPAVPSFLETTTAADGTFTFANFPLGYQMGGDSIQVLQGDNGTTIGQIDQWNFEEVYASVPSGASSAFASATKAVDLGTLYAAPTLNTFKVVSYSWQDEKGNNVDVATDASLKITFNKEVTGWATATVSGTSQATFAIDATDKKVVNITFADPLAGNTTFNVNMSNITTGVAGDNLSSVSTSFKTVAILALVSTNYTDVNGVITNFAVADPIKLIFNRDLASYESVVLKDGSGKLVDAAVAIDATDKKMLVVTPAAALAFGTQYEVEITKLMSTKTGDSAYTNLAIGTFTTVKGAALAKPALVKVFRPAAAGTLQGTTKYNSGTTSFRVQASKAAADASVTGFTFQYKANDEVGWTGAVGTLVTQNGTDYIYDVTTAALESGKSVSIRVIATRTGYVDSPVSDAVTFADEVAPTALLGASSYTSTAAVQTDTLATQAIGDLVPEIQTRTIALAGSEKMSLPVITVGATAVTGFTYSIALNAAGTEATLTIVIAAGTATTANDPAGQLKIALKDAAGNDLDLDTTTTAVDGLTINF